VPELVIVDVGCAIGEFSEFILESGLNVKIYALEPNINFFGEKLSKIKLCYPSKFYLLPYALGKSSGKALMYGTSQLNGQIGSLKKFNLNKKWDEYLDTHLDKDELSSVITVETKSVYDFLVSSGLKEIDFLKIDAQGSDIDILEQFLLKLNVRCIVLEVNVSSNKYENIYQGDNSLTRLSKIIAKYDLDILKIVPNRDFTELNVFLAKNFEMGLNIIEELKISFNPVFRQGWSVNVVSNLKEEKLSSARMFLRLLQLLSHPVRTLKKLSKLI